MKKQNIDIRKIDIIILPILFLIMIAILLMSYDRRETSKNHQEQASLAHISGYPSQQYNGAI